MIGALAAAVGAAASWRPSFWTDEAATISAARRSWSQLWSLLGNLDAVHGAYYALMHVWTDVFGTSALALRLPSALATGVAAAGVVVLARQLSTRRIALLAGLVYVVLPRVTWAAVEARSYALSSAVIVWAVVALVVAIRRGRRWWVLYGFLLVCSALVFVYSALVALAVGVTLAWTWRRRLRRLLPWLVTTGLALAVAAPLVAVVVRESGQVRPGPVRPVKTTLDLLVSQWFLGALPSRSQHVHATATVWLAGALLLAVLFWAGVAWLVVSRSARPPRAAGAPVGVVALCVPWLLLPAFVVVAYSAIRTPVYSPRYFTFATPAVALMAGSALAALRVRTVVVAGCAVVLACALPVYVSQRTTYAKKASDWSTVARTIGERAAAGDVVIFEPLVGRNGVTSRKVAVAYPSAFANLRDVTLRLTGPEHGSLWGRSRPVREVLGSLDGRPVWLLTDRKSPVDGTVAVLATAGYHVVWSWTGPASSLYELRR